MNTTLLAEARLMLRTVDATLNDVKTMQEEVTSFEYFVRLLVVSSSPTVMLPTTATRGWAAPSALRERLPASLRKRVTFIDSRFALWRAVRSYFDPITKVIPEDKRMLVPIDEAANLQELAWATYLLLLATESNTELTLQPDVSIAACRKAAQAASASREAVARLAMLESVFRSFTQTVELPAFRIVLSPNATLRERIDEILEDAHFLEVSALRQFFGVAQNRYAVARDLKKLMQWIVRTKRWALGAVKLGSQLAHVPEGQ